MSDEQNSRGTFIIPQRGAGRRVREETAKRNIDQIRLETAEGGELVVFPVEVNVKKAVPSVLRLPMQAAVTALSAVARVFRVNIIFRLGKDDN